MEDFQDISKLSDNPAELKMIDELQQLEISEPGIRRASSALGKLKNRYQSALKLTTKVAVRSKWALYKKSQFEELLRVIAEQITVLEQLFPQQERDLAAAEVTWMNRDAIKVLAPIAASCDPLLAQALRAEAPRRSFNYENITATGNAMVHLGDNYRTVPENEVAPSWTDIKKDGNVVVHNYEYDTLPQMQWADRHRPPAIDDDGWLFSRPHSSRKRKQPDPMTDRMDDDARSLGRSYSGRKALDIPTELEEPAYLRPLSTRQDDQIMAARSIPKPSLSHGTQHEAERDTNSSLHQLEPLKPLLHRSDVYDDGLHSPQGSVTAPETYSTNSKPFQGSIEYSSEGDSPKRALSSSTGLETHVIPERESGSIQRNCSNDEHVSDTMSIHTDGREHNLDPDTKLSLTGAFAGHIVENLTPQQLNDLFNQRHAIDSIAELIGDFSVLLGVSIAADDDARSRAVTLVRHQRTESRKSWLLQQKHGDPAPKTKSPWRKS